MNTLTNLLIQESVAAMGIKDVVLNKGWAGRTISRHETANRLNPVIESLTRLMHVYDGAISGLDGEARDALSATQKMLRTDLGRLSETVLSAGGAPYTGVDLEPADGPAGGDVVADLVRAEEAFRSDLEAEHGVEHQMRTRAVLETVSRNSSERLKLLRSLDRR